MEQILLVMTTMPDAAAAQSLARALVESRLAACVNLLPGAQSVYRWQGTIEQASEVTLLVKTTQQRFAQLRQAILSSHPYDLPEVLAVPVSEGHLPYLQWIAAETRQDDHA